MTEDEFERSIVDVAHAFGWRAVGHRPMRTKHGWRTGWKYDGTGWPDLTLIHSKTGLMVIAELKVPGGRLSHEQTVWATRLEAVEAKSHGSIRYRLWRPDDWDSIVTLLSFGRAGTGTP